MTSALEQDHSVDTPSLAVINGRYASASPQETLRAAIHDLFPSRIALVSSFGAESVVLLHLIAQIDPSLPIIFLNTGKLFGETLRYRDRLQELLGLTDIRSAGPHPDDLQARDPAGDLWTKSTDDCCHIRKVLPQARSVRGFDALITGRKRFQTNARASMNIFEQDADGRFKINPLANWDLAALKTYIEAHHLPRHPLVKQNYLSIGCMPCTDRVDSETDYRAGRWAGQDKEECGIHVNTGGDGI